MKPWMVHSWLTPVVLGFFTGVTVMAQPPGKSDSERLRELEVIVQQLREQNQSLQQRVGELERGKAKPMQTLPMTQAAAPGSGVGDHLPVTINQSSVISNQSGTEPAGKSSTNILQALKSPPELAQPWGQQSPVIDRGAFEDEQVGAPRPGDLTLDPKYRGFFPIPNTPVLVKINAKPRVDFIADSHNPGDPSRFRPGQFPTEGSPGYGGPSDFNVTAQGSRLMLDVRGPEMSGSPRFYYENDFFGSSGNSMSLRVRHLYGQLYNVIVGQTWSTFTDPDALPDTVDYEGPNSSVLTRQPLVRYIQPLTEHWQLNFGIEQPNSQVDVGAFGGSAVNRAPDFGANVRWEKAGVGHLQLSGIARLLGTTGGASGSQEVFGGGLNLAGAVRVFGQDNVIGQIMYGKGIGHYGHDSSSFPTDAALDADGNLVALPYLGLAAGYTHHWNDRLRSSLTYGYVTLDNEAAEAATSYHRTHYGALNLIWQPFPFKNLNLGLEGLYGVNEVKSGATGDDWRVQLGIVYSLF